MEWPSRQWLPRCVSCKLRRNAVLSERVSSRVGTWPRDVLLLQPQLSQERPFVFRGHHDDSRPSCSCLPGDSCYDCLEGPAAATRHMGDCMTSVWSPFNLQFIRFVICDKFLNEPQIKKIIKHPWSLRWITCAVGSIYGPVMIHWHFHRHH